MTFPLINYDGNKGENNDDEAGQRSINHVHEGRQDTATKITLWLTG